MIVAIPSPGRLPTIRSYDNKDPNQFAFSGVVPMALDTLYDYARSIGIICSVAGNASFTFQDGSILIVPVAVGFQTLPFAVTKVNTTGTTATATFFNLL